MKKITFVITIAIAAVCSFTGCEKESISNNSTKNLCLMDYDAYARYGMAHNAYLSNINDLFVEDNSVTTLDECMSFLASFNKIFTTQLTDFTFNEKTLLNDSFDQFKSFYRSSSLYDEVFGKGTILSQIEWLYDADVITVKDVEVVNELLVICNEQYSNKITISEYHKKIHDLDSKVRCYADSSSITAYTGSIINIAIYSADWWMSHPEQSKIAPWVASDAVGAAVGATVSAVTSYAQNHHVNWTGVAVSAVSGAVTGSTGVVGKVGKWISKVL